MLRSAWLPEIVSYGVAICAFVNTIWFLRWRDGKPLPNWPGVFTVNFVLSAFTTVFKAAILMPVAEGLSELKWIWFDQPHLVRDMEDFDLASRGPRGSFRFLCRFPYNKLACLGALIIFAGLFIDPVTQLAIQNAEMLVESPTRATISRTNNFTLDSAADMKLMVHRTGSGAWLSSIYQGLLNPPANSSASVSFDCPSGNCTFGSYSSLAICSSVLELSNTIFSNGPSSNLYYSLPSGLEVHDEIPFISAQTQPDKSHKTPQPIFEMELLMLLLLNPENCKGHDLSDSACQTTPAAFSVSFYPCIKTFQSANVSRFALSENLQSVKELPLVLVSDQTYGWANTTSAHYKMNSAIHYSFAGDLPAVSSLDCSPVEFSQGNKTQATGQLLSGELYALSADIPIGSYNGHPVSPRINNIDASAKILYFDPECTFAFGSNASAMTSNYLKDNFFGAYISNVTSGDTRTIRIYPYDVDSDGHFIANYGEIWLRRLYNGGTANLDSVTAFATELSDALSATLRQLGDDSNNAPVIGGSWVNQTVIRFDWKYLTYNALLLLGTLVFMLLTSWRARSMEESPQALGARGPWKSSTLPLLWCSLEDKARRQYGMQDYVDKDMSRSSDMLEVKLVKVAESPSTAISTRTYYSEQKARMQTRDGDTEIQCKHSSNSEEVAREESRWVLQAQYHHPNPCNTSRVRRFFFWLGDYIPI